MKESTVSQRGNQYIGLTSVWVSMSKPAGRGDCGFYPQSKHIGCEARGGGDLGTLKNGLCSTSIKEKRRNLLNETLKTETLKVPPPPPSSNSLTDIETEKGLVP